MLVRSHGLSLSLARVHLRVEGRPGKPIAEAHDHDQYRDWEVRVCCQALMTVVHGVVPRERTSLRQPGQVRGSQDVWASRGPMIVGGNSYHEKGLHDGMREFEQVRVGGGWT